MQSHLSHLDPLNPLRDCWHGGQLVSACNEQEKNHVKTQTIWQTFFFLENDLYELLERLDVLVVGHLQPEGAVAVLNNELQHAEPGGKLRNICQNYSCQEMISYMGQR